MFRLATHPAYPLDNSQAESQLSVQGSLCRDLCRNPPIPTHVGRSRTMCLGSNLQSENNHQPRMNRAHSYRAVSFQIVWSLIRQRTVTAEAAGSSPVVPAIIPKQ